MALKYEEYLKMLKDNATQKYDATMARAKDTLKEQQTAANAAFERSKPTYGMMAEQMAQSGLTGSGYSDNLTRDAYAARQAGYDSAYKTYGDTARVAEQTKYADLLAAEREGLSYSEKIAEAFSTYYDGISAGESIDSIKNIVASNGFTKGQADALWSKAGWGSTMPTDVYDGLFGTVTADGAETPAPTPESTPTATLSPNTTNAVDAWRSNLGEITVDDFKPVYDALIAGDPAAKDAILAFLRETPKIGGMTDTSQGTTVADYLYSRGVIGKDVWEEAKAEAERKEVPTDKPVATGITVKKGLNTSNKKDNFVATDGNRNYRVQIGEKQTDGTILNKASGLEDGTIFMYNGTPYVKVDTDDGFEVWNVEQKAWTDLTGQYAAFLDAAKAHMKNTGGIEGVEVNVGEYNDLLFATIAGVDVGLEGENADATAYANANGITSNQVFEKDGTFYCVYEGAAYSVPKKHYEEIKKNIDIITGESPANLKPVSAELSGTADIGWLGNNFTAKIGDTKYKVQTGDRATALETLVAKEGSSIPEKSLFTYDGKLYMRDKKKVYEVEARPVFNKGDYADLIAALRIKE